MKNSGKNCYESVLTVPCETWYEIYELDPEKGPWTLEAFDTREEAESFYRDLLPKYETGAAELHMDRWVDTGTGIPEAVEVIH